MKKSILFLIVTAVIFGGLFLLSLRSPKVKDQDLVKADPTKIIITPEFIDFEKVKFGGGIVIKEYEIKNDSEGVLRLKKIVTSCKCTRASVSVDGKKTDFYAMEMGGDKNPRINFDIPAGKTAKLTVKFDPALHGLKGIGKFDRVITLTFADPVGIKEAKFSGEIIP